MCVKGGRIKVWCLISRGAGDYFSRLERILEFKQYGGRKGKKKKKVRVQWHMGLKRAQTRAAAQLSSSPQPGPLTAGSRQDHSDPRGKEHGPLTRCLTLHLCHWGEYTTTKVMGHAPEHVLGTGNFRPILKLPHGIFFYKSELFMGNDSTCKTFFLREKDISAAQCKVITIFSNSHC